MALCATACGDGRDDEAPRTASAAVEAAWIGRLQRWIEVESGNGTFGDCAAKLATVVGAPPSHPLEEIAAVAGDMCRDFDGWRSGQANGLRTNDRALYVRAQSDLDRAKGELQKLARLASEHIPGTASVTLPRVAKLTGESREEPKFAAVASKLAGAPVVLRCWSTSDWPRVSRAYSRRNDITFDLAGFANPVTRAIDLAPGVCTTLARIRYGGGDTALQESFALDVLAHESMHMLEEQPSEATTECYAMQRIATTGSMLGMEPDAALRRAILYFDRLYPEQLPDYRSPDCRAGGPLDQSPDGSWP